MLTTPTDIARLPLFIGLTAAELTDIITQTHFDRRHHKKGHVFIEEYTPCTSLTFVTKGKLETDTYAASRSYHMAERTDAPIMVEPDKLFGLTTHYRSSYKALTPCDSLTISKEELMRIFTHHMIVRLNFLNIISKKTQYLDSLPWQNHSDQAKERITSFIRQHSAYPTGHKILYIKMATLASELHFNRLDISNALNAMQDEEKIRLRRGIIDVPELKLLE